MTLSPLLWTPAERRWGGLPAVVCKGCGWLFRQAGDEVYCSQRCAGQAVMRALCGAVYGSAAATRPIRATVEPGL